MGPLDEPRRRLNRAHNTIAGIKRFLPGRDPAIPTGDVVVVDNPHDGTKAIVFRRVEPIRDEFRLGIGDVIHDLRTSLDYLAYRLAIRKGFPASGRTEDQLKDLRKVAFLISDEKGVPSPAKKLRPLIGRPAVTAMEQLQRDKPDRRAPILWTLSQLDNITKHRMIAVVAPELVRVDLVFDVDGQDVPQTIHRPTMKLEDGATLLTFGADRRVKKLKWVPKIVFANTDGVCDGRDVFGVMRESVNAVRTVLDEFELKFFR